MKQRIFEIVRLTVIDILGIINWYSKIAVSNIVYLLTSMLLRLTHFSLYQNSMVISTAWLSVAKIVFWLKCFVKKNVIQIKEVVSWISKQSVVADFSEASVQKNRRIGFHWQEARKRTVRTAENVGVVEEMSMSQETAPGSHHTVHQIAREVGRPIYKTTVHNIVCQDLKLKCLRKINK